MPLQAYQPGDRAVALLIRDREVLVIQRHQPGRSYYVLPGGSVEAGETPEEACRREVFEETGLTATVCTPVGTYDNRGRMEHYFLVESAPGVPRLGAELNRQTDSNTYAFEWVDIERMAAVDLKPEFARSLCFRHLEQS